MDRIGRYKVTRELGRGAMGVVYHAIDPNIGRAVAIKTIRLGEVSNPQERARLRERLFREARSAGILSHPGIVTIYDVEQQGDLAYIAMEFVDGPTLDDLLSGPRTLARDQVFAILGQTAVALDYAHQKGIVHRDIKPANIMVTADGSAKITDFGIAKITASEQFTMTGTIVGTPHYMSPEQVQGHPVDGRADQFSLAVIAFEMLTGDKPFTGEQLTTVVYRIVAEEPAPALRLNASLSPQIESTLRRGLAKKPDARYRNCEDFVNALEEACAASPAWRPLPRGGGMSEPTMGGGPRPELPPPYRRRSAEAVVDEERRRRVRPVSVLLALLVLAGVLGLIAWQAAPWVAARIAAQEAPAAAPDEPPALAPAEKRPSAFNPPPETPAAPPATETPAAAPSAASSPDAEQTASAPPAVQAPEPPPAPRASSFAVLVTTNPPGAAVVLDGQPDTECKAPCSLRAAPGRHSVSLSLPGYQVERREVDVTGAPQELPLISLRPAGGTLMISSAPEGATILVNGRAVGQKTPAQVSLAPGTYAVTLEKDGRRATDRVEIRNGDTVYRKLPLAQ